MLASLGSMEGLHEQRGSSSLSSEEVSGPRERDSFQSECSRKSFRRWEKDTVSWNDRPPELGVISGEGGKS